MPAGKSLQHQVDEVRDLVANASELLRQANWAMETLAGRVAEAPDPIPRPAVPVRETPAAVPPAVSEPEPIAAAESVPAEEPERRRRHLRWVQGTRGAL